MPVTLITGPIGSGKSLSLKEDLLGDAGRENAVLILPDRRAAADVRASILSGARCPRRAIRGDSVSDLRSFVARVADPRVPLMGRLHRVMLVHRILSRAKLSYFDKAKWSVGLAGQFADAILSLKGGGVSAEETRKMARAGGARARRETDLAAIYADYEREKTRLGLLDDADLIFLAIRRIEEGSSPVVSNLSLILFDEFHRPDAALLSLLSAIVKARPDLRVQISFPTASEDFPGEELFAGYLGSGLEKLSPLADRVKELGARARRRPEVEIFCARSPAQEARFAAAIVADLASEDFSPRDVVVFADPAGGFMRSFRHEAGSMAVIGAPGASREVKSSPFMSGILSPEFVERLPESARPSEFASLLRAAAPDGETLARWSGALARHEAARAAIAANASAVGALLDALSAMEAGAALTATGALRRDDFVRLLSEALPRGSSSADEMLLPFRVASPLAPLPVGARAVIVPRMLEGSVPRPLCEPTFFANWDEPRISSAIPTPAELFAAGAYAFETAASKCGERLVLIYPAVDESGKEAMRSSFLDRFLCEGAKPEYAPAITPRPSAAGMPGWEERLSLAVGVEAARRGGHERRPGFSGELSSKEAVSLVAKRFGEEDIRVTALEDYAECPFAFFVSHVLGAREKPDDTPELSPLARGTIVHDVLKLFYSRHAKDAVAARKDAAARKRIEAAISKLADEVWDEHERDVAGVAPGLVARGKRSVEKLVMQVVDAEIDEARRLPSPMRPLECEWPFGSADGRPLTIEIGGGERASLSGRIDRVDSDEPGSSFLVIDYKTGATGPVIGDMKKGLHLQLPLYVDAAGRFLCPGARAMGEIGRASCRERV